MTSERIAARTRRSSAAALAIALLALLTSSTGCISLAGDQLADIELRPLRTPPPSIEQTVGNFSFHLDGGKMITSNKAGRNVNKLILDRWQKRGLITTETYVGSSQFTGKADYNLTLAGHQQGESSVVMQFLSGLTLFIVPYWVNTQFDLVYTLEHVETGRKFEAHAADSHRTIVELLLLPISPFAMGGAMRTYNRLADHVYDQLAERGAFDPASWTEARDPVATPSDVGVAPNADVIERPAVDRMRVLEQLRKDGLVTSEEYERKKQEILGDL